MQRHKNTTRIFATLCAANEAILRTTSEDELFQRVCEAAVAGGKLFAAAALLADADASMRMVAGYGNQIENLQNCRISADRDSACEWALAATAFQTDQPAFSGDCIDDRRFPHRHQPAELLTRRSAAAVPIRRNGSTIGALLFCFGEPYVLDDEAPGALERISANFSYALDNFEERTQKRDATRALERLSRMFAALTATNEAIMRASTRAELCARVCEAAVLDGTFTSAVISLTEPDRHSLRVVAVAGTLRNAMQDSFIPIGSSCSAGRSLTEIAFTSKKAIFSNDYVADQRSMSLRELVRDSSNRSIASFPLFKNDVTIGTLTIAVTVLGAFSSELIELLQRVADNLSFALGNFDRADEKTHADEQIQYLATHDGLTGLHNRVMFGQLLNVSIAASRRHDRQFAVLFIDLDRFKIINDTLGHADGDKLLFEIGRRLRECVRASDVVARLGGDEFVIVLQEIEDTRHVADVARKLLVAVSKPIVLSGQECRVTASIGISMFPLHGADEQTLMTNADMAMYLAKKDGKNDIRFYSEAMKGPSTERLVLEASLRHALEREEFVVHYQPKRDLQTEQITGVEALLRWNHPDLGFLPPAEFIALAEETGLIIPIGLWVLKAACKQSVAWRHAGLPAISMAVNLSPRQFADERLLELIDQVLAETGMAAEHLQLEITESMIMADVEKAIEVLTMLKSRGIHLAIDDFGIGYSSMSFIKRFPVDVLKIDRSFIRDLPQNVDDKAIADAIIGLGRALGLTIIAEGVETTPQELFLRDHACDEMQGFLFSEAVSAEAVGRLLQSGAVQPAIVAAA